MERPDGSSRERSEPEVDTSPYGSLWGRKPEWKMGVLIGGRRQEIHGECRKTSRSVWEVTGEGEQAGSEGSNADCTRGRDISERRVGILLV